MHEAQGERKSNLFDNPVHDSSDEFLAIEIINVGVFLLVDTWSELDGPSKAIVAPALFDGRRGSFEATERSASYNGSLAFKFKVNVW